MELLLLARVALLVFVSFSLIPPTEAKATTVGSMSYLHGDGYASGDNTRNTLRVDVTHVKSAGLLYGRLDNLSFDDHNSQVVSRLVGQLNVAHGFHLAAQTQNQLGSSAISVGIGYTYLTKDARFGVDLNRMSSNAYGDTTHIFSFWGTPDFNDLYSEGHIDYFMRDTGANVLFLQLHYAKQGQWFSLGLEQQFYENKGGVFEFLILTKVKYTF